MDKLEVYKPGSWVMIGDNIPATVVQVCVGTGMHVEYEVVWWDGAEREKDWFDAFEVKEHPKSKIFELGFHTIGEQSDSKP